MEQQHRNSRRRAAALAAGLLLFVAALRPSAAQGAVELDEMFTFNAVLQQGGEVPVFGTADAGDRVTVRFQEHVVEGIVKDGRWRAVLPPLAPGGPYTLEVSGTSSHTVRNLFVGEVWVCAGQSNMQWSVFRSKNSGAAMIAPENRRLHFYNVAREPADEPKYSNSSTWSVGSAATISNFSAVGYYFGRELAAVTDVPIGLINCSHYLSTTEAWVQKKTLESDPALKPIVDDTLPGRKDPLAPGTLFNGMVSPIAQYAVRGVICYEGDNASKTAAFYDKLFAAQIADWRRAWGKPEMPFLFVQIAPSKPPGSLVNAPNLALIREAQTRVWQNTLNTAMIVSTDYGDAYSMHPAEKEPIGKRLALAARAIAYGESIPYSGPTYKNHAVINDHVVVGFDRIGDGLKKAGDKLLGFTLAGDDGQFQPAEALIVGPAVLLKSDKVPQPRHVRYAWADFPVCNLYNSFDLPAVPFRTDVPNTATSPSEK